MRSSKKYLFFSIGIILVLCCFLFTKNFRNKNIDVVLKWKSYNYLPMEAKNYIKDVYEKTGNVILTEKNKKDNTPYLNPDYVNYISSSEEEKLISGIVPNTMVTDFKTSNYETNDSLPEKFDLRNISGNNYLSPMKDQGKFGLCWAFASLEQVESYLMYTQNKPYDENSKIFSIRQLDYAVSTDGINNYENDFGMRPLTAGGNFYMSSFAMANGITIIDDEKMPYDGYDKNSKELHEVLNYENSLYEVNSTIMMSRITSSSSSKDKENYNKIVKTNLLKYGSAYVATGSPKGSCGAFNVENNSYIIIDGSCSSYSNYGSHAMQIIGWDDNYKYSVCSNGKNMDKYDNGCSSGYTQVNGKGAWILKNSWGTEEDNLDYQYVYLAYESINIDIAFSTDISEMKDRNWDNNYHDNLWSKSGNDDTLSQEFTFKRNIYTSEKIMKIKFFAFGQDGSYTLKIKSDNLNYTYNKDIITTLPGIYTIDLSNENIILTDNVISVTIESKNDVYLLRDSVSVFTSNIEKTPFIQANNFDSANLKVHANGNYSYLLYSDTKNIKSNEIISYKLLDYETKEEVSYLINVENNIVAKNNINATLTFSKDIPSGNYILRATYDNENFDLQIYIPFKYDLEGSGTKTNPYKIYNEDDLKQIQNHLDSYFVIKNDIYLTEKWKPIGSKNNPFSGSIDGENHTISYLNIDKDTKDAVGFIGYYNPVNSFDYTDENNIYKFYISDNYIKNINFNSANVKNTGPAGILIGDIIFDKKYIENSNKYFRISNIGEAKFNIDSVYFNYSVVESSESDAGVISSNIDIVPISFNQPQLNINNVFSTSSITGKTSGGLIGFINDSYISASGIMLQINMTNIQNAGLIDTVKYELDYTSSKGFSHIIGKINNNAALNIENFIINSIFNDNKYTHEFNENNNNYGLIGECNSINRTIKVKNGYYFSNILYPSDTIEQIAVKASDITDASKYENWVDFDKYWELKTVDGTPRIPVLKNGMFGYTKFDDITLNLYDKYYILDNLTNNLFQNITNTYITLIDEDNNVIDFDYYDSNKDHYFEDYIISALQKGTTKIHIESNYDGNVKDISVNVISQKVNNPTISYYKNVKGSDENFSTSLDKNTSFVINDNTFINKGYRFNSWNTLPNGKGIKYTEKQVVSEGIDEDMRLYAQWDLIKYKLIFNANNGTDKTIIMDNVSFSSLNSSVSCNTNEFKYNYYKFDSWNTSPDGTGKKFLISNSLSVDDFIEYSENNVLNLYAIWKENKASITYCYDSSCTQMEKYDYELGSNVTIIDNSTEIAGYTFKSWNTKYDGSGNDYFANNKIYLNKDLTLYPIYTQNFSYKINNYEVNENENYISKIKPNTSTTDILTNIKFGENYSAHFDVNNNLIYTGGKTTIYYNSSIVKEYYNIVIGDINGDGLVNSADLLKIRQHLIGTIQLNGVYYKSSDINYDNVVNSADLLKIRQHLIGTKLIG